MSKKAVSTVKYTGTVSLKIVKNGKVIKSTKVKNEGYNHLFRCLATLIAGQDATPMIPNYIDASDKLPTEPNYESSLYNVVPITSRQTELGSDVCDPSSAILTAAINASNVQAGKSSMIKYLILQYVSSAGVENCASIAVPEDFTNIGQGLTLIIDWKLTFGNGDIITSSSDATGD